MTDDSAKEKKRLRIIKMTKEAGVWSPEPPADKPKAEGVAAGTDEVGRLAGLPKLDYDQQRQKVAKALGVRVSVLDGLVAERRRDIKAQAKGNGDGELEPWPDPVDGATLLEAIRERVAAYVVLPEHGAEAVALWALFAHAHDAFQVSPIPAVKSPRERCGKSTLLMILKGVVPRPMIGANCSPAVIFRVIEKARPTLLIDEGDSFLGDNEELRGILNSGHLRDSA